MSIELPKDAEGREIPLDTKVLYGDSGQAYEIETYCYAVHEDMPDHKWGGALLFSKKSVELKSIRTTALYPTRAARQLGEAGGGLAQRCGCAELRSLRLFWQECMRLFIVHRRQRRNLRKGCHARHRRPHPQA